MHQQTYVHNPVHNAASSRHVEIREMTEKWYITINLDKTSISMFFLLPRDTVPNLNLGSHLIKEENYATNLGATCDRKLK